MNVIAYDRAYCLYPRATLEERLSLVTTTRADDVIDEVWDRYTHRGWTIIHDRDVIPTLTTDICLRAGFARWINDGFAWSIALPVDFHDSLPRLNARTEHLFHDPVSISSWKLWHGRRHGPVEIRFEIISSVNMFYQYVTAKPAMARTPAVVALTTMAKYYNVGTNARGVRH